MSRRVGLIALALLTAAGRMSAQEIGVTVDVDRRQLFLGESVVLTIKVSGILNPPDPDLSALRDCSVSFVNSQVQNLQSITIVNGKVQKTGFKGRIFTYEVTPAKTGLFNTGPVRLIHDGRTYAGMGPQVEVSGVEAQDWVIVALRPSREVVLVDEPFTITLSVAVKRLPAPFSDIDPFDTKAAPDLTIPYLQGKPMSGLEGPDVRETLRGMLTSGRRSAGFGINGLTVQRDPFSSIFDFGTAMGQTMAYFQFSRRPARLRRADYLEYVFPMTYTPKAEGIYAFGPVTFKGSIFTAINDAGQATARRVYTVGETVTVRVVPPREEGRPPSYIGAIGSNLVVDAELDAQTCYVGDPLSLSLSISGDISLDNVRAPNLSLQPRLAEDFRIYEDTSQVRVEDDIKTWTYTLRPLRAGTLEVPPIDVSYYDVTTRTYETVSTRPIPVVARPAAQVAEDIIVAATNGLPATAGPERTVLPVAPIAVDPAGADPAAPWPGAGPLVMLVLTPVVCLLAGLGRLIHLHRTTTADARRRLAGKAEAERILRRAAALARRSPGEARTLLVAGIRKHLANVFTIVEGGITPADAARLLRREGVDEATIRDLTVVMEQHFNADYAPSTGEKGNIAGDVGAVRTLLRRIDKLIALVAVIVLGAAATGQGADALERWFMWEEANARMASADSAADFLQAARSYRELLADGVENGPLLHNLGTALLLAERYRPALAAFETAEVYLGWSPAVSRNMRLAALGDEDSGGTELPWHRIPLFWHYRMSLRLRTLIAALAFAGIGVAALLAILGVKRRWRLVFLPCLLVLALFGSSVGASLHTLSRGRATLLLFDIEPSALPPPPEQGATP